MTRIDNATTTALKRLLSAAQVTMDLWDEHGLGDDHWQSEQAHAAMVAAIAEAREVLKR